MTVDLSVVVCYSVMLYYIYHPVCLVWGIYLCVCACYLSKVLLEIMVISIWLSGSDFFNFLWHIIIVFIYIVVIYSIFDSFLFSLGNLFVNSVSSLFFARYDSNVLSSSWLLYSLFSILKRVLSLFILLSVNS